MQRRELPDGWEQNLPSFPADPKGIAGREASGKVLNVLARNIPWLLGGAADLAPSTKTKLDFPSAGDLEAATPGGRNLHFGVREHAMAAIVNGLALSKLRAFGATFFIFSDYARPAIRLSAIMELPAIWIFSHDAMGDGEDGPTHQPVEQLVSLRAIPGLVLLRPADANEVVEAYRYVLQLRHKPAAIVLSRQALPTFDRSRYASAEGVRRGGRAGRFARDHSHRDRERGFPRRRCARTADRQGSEIPRRLNAVVGYFRRPAAILPRQRAAAAGDGAHRGRAGVDARLGPVCRVSGQGRRHEDVRRIRTAEGAAAQIRLRAGAHRGTRHRHAAEQAMTRNDPAPAAEGGAVAAPPCAMVIFGAAGDLTKRLLVPALYDLVRARRLPDAFRLVGIATTEQTTADWRRDLTEMMSQFVTKGGGEFSADHLDQAAWDWLTTRMTYFPGDLNDRETYRRLGKQLAELDEKAGTAGNYLF